MSGLHVLVVDDEPFVLTTVSMLLRLEGHTVRTASNGRSGLELALELQPDLILSDLHMPGCSGLDLLAAVRADARMAHTRVVLLTGDTDTVTGTGAMAPDAWLGKPFAREQLLQLLQRWGPQAG